MKQLSFGKINIKLPASRVSRLILGVALVIGGMLGFLPILGFWMIPLGLLVLSHDLKSVRRWRRRMIVRLGNWLIPRYPAIAARLGFGVSPNRSS